MQVYKEEAAAAKAMSEKRTCASFYNSPEKRAFQETLPLYTAYRTEKSRHKTSQENRRSPGAPV